MAAFLVVPFMSRAKDRDPNPPRPSSAQTPVDLARDRLRTYLRAYAGEYPELRGNAESKLLVCVRNKSLGWSKRGVALAELVLSPHRRGVGSAGVA
jgi:hypothetical protein